MTMPLEGIRVLDLSQVWAMPGAGMHLADQGADVIKVEPLFGDEARRILNTAYLKDNTPSFLVVNRNKRGIALDITRPQGKEIVHRLVRETDVVLLNYRPGVAERLGYGYEDLRAVNPRIIYACATPYGYRGNWAQRRGYDMLFQALSGQMMRSPAADGTPVGAMWTVDTAGAMALAYGIMLALYRRERTGQSQRMDATMLQISHALQSVGMVKAFKDDLPKERAVRHTPTLYRCADGGWLQLIIIRAEDWRKLCLALGIEHLSSRDTYEATRTDPHLMAEVSQVLAGVFETRPRDAWVEILLGEDLPAAPVLLPEEAMALPHALENGMFVDVEHPVAGPLRMIAPVVKVLGAEPAVRRAAPVLGQHTDDVLGEVGYSREQIAALRREGVVG